MAVTPDLDVAVQAAVVLATGLVAAMVFAANPRRSWNQWLTFFLLLVCGNYLANGIVLASGDAGAGTVPAPAISAAKRLGTLFLIWDPAALVYFASVFPRRTFFAERPAALAGLALPVLALTTLEVFSSRISLQIGPHVPGLQGLAPEATGFFLIVYMLACYGYAGWRVYANFLAEPSTIMAQQVRLVATGVLVACLVRIAVVWADEPVSRLFTDLVGGAAGIVHDASRIVLLWTGLAVIVALGAGHALDAERQRERQHLLRVLVAIFLCFTLIWSFGLAYSLWVFRGAAAPAWLLDLNTVASLGLFAFRWFVFCGAMFYGIARYQLLAVGPQLLGRGGAALSLFTAVLAGGLAGQLWGPWPAAAAAVAVLLGGLALVRVSVGRLAPKESKYLRERRLEVYRAMLAATLAQGGAAPEAELRAARERLGISPREHEALLAVAQAEESRSASPATLLGRYELLRKLGTGGYATVYLARDRRDGGLVVLKRIRADQQGSREALAAALREFEVGRRVSHPGLVAIHDMVELDDGAVVVMQYCEGGSVRELLGRERRLAPERAAPLLRDALHALASLHDAGLVHGDIKPENLLLTADGRVKVSDFGVSRAAEGGRTLVQATVEGGAGGTLLYMAPEQVRGETVSAQTDLYALGAVAHEMLTGKPFIDAKGLAPYTVAQHILEGPPASDLLAPAWKDFIARATAPDPRQRFRSAEEMLGRLAVLAEEPAQGATKRLRPSKTRWPGV